MIIVENITIGDKEYTRTYSDDGRFVVRDGEEYEEAIDPINSGRVYTEGEPILAYDDVEVAGDELI